MRVRVPGAALVLLLAVAACGGSGGGGGGNGSAERSETTIGGLEAQYHGTEDVSATGKVDVRMDDNYFEPTVLEGKPGQKLTIELRNDGVSAHTFTTADRVVDREVQSGEEAEVVVTFPTSGEMTFVCRYHESGSMVGALKPSGTPAPSTTNSSSDY